MVLNDIKIKESIRLYLTLTGKEKGQALECFRREIEMYVYHFPRMAYRKGLDDCSEFYIYLLERIESVIKNYPLDAEIQFKTWFNYVLKNQLINFYRFKKKSDLEPLSLEDCEASVPAVAIEYDESGMQGLKNGLSGLDELDRVFLKFYYLPELLESSEFLGAVRFSGRSLAEVLDLQKRLITIQLKNVDRIRLLSEKISALNQDIVAIKYKLHRDQTGLAEKNALLIRISRLDASRSRLIRQMELPDKNYFIEFSSLFRSRAQAKIRLKIAKEKLKIGLIKQMKQSGEVA